jgi:hypothetical protein
MLERARERELGRVLRVIVVLHVTAHQADAEAFVLANHPVERAVIARSKSRELLFVQLRRRLGHLLVLALCGLHGSVSLTWMPPTKRVLLALASCALLASLQPAEAHAADEAPSPATR